LLFLLLLLLPLLLLLLRLLLRGRESGVYALAGGASSGDGLG
jgi:hypothetical protein